MLSRPRARSGAKAVLGVALLAAVFVLPRMQSEYQLLVSTRLLLLALMAQGWNFIGGYTGYAAFGNVAFFGIGAYGTGLLMISRWHLSFFPALALGAILACVVAVVIGLAVLRLTGHYFAVATLGVAEALRELCDNLDGITEGSTGIDLPVTANGAFFYYSALAMVLAGVGLTAVLVRAKIGYAWLAIREDQVAARSLGINTTAAKVLAFALSAIFAALAGGITAYQNIHVTPTDFFKIEYTLQMIIACVIGGTGTVFGPLIGAGVYQLLSTYVWSHFIDLHPSVLGGMIVFFVILSPRGLMPILGAVGALASGERRFHWRSLLFNVRAHRVT
jgi:branched-chain amino acid transport system permease protein